MAKQTAESSSPTEESLSALPCLVTMNPGVRIVTVAAGGRHTLSLSGKLVAIRSFDHLEQSCSSFLE